MPSKNEVYPAQLDIEYQPKLSRVTTLFRGILAVPIVILLSIVVGTSYESYIDKDGHWMTQSGASIITALFFATVLMVLFRKVYPKWWFDFLLELNRFIMRVTAYVLLLTDKYPSTVDAQTVQLTLIYPDVQKDLRRGMPLVKWLLAFPHYIILIVLSISLVFTTIVAWFAILITGKYPRGLFDFAVGVYRWNLRVAAYMQLLITDKYPPFSLK